MKIKRRCWGNNDKDMSDYHDRVWGVPNHSDKVHFEFLILEGAQAGLSWQTILKRRKGYKKAFENFDFNKVAKMTERDVNRLLKDTGIIRNRLKINSAINNAKVFIEIRKEYGSFDNYIWGFTKGKVIDSKMKSFKGFKGYTDLSEKISKDLKSRGMSFVGSTIIYAYLEAVGIVNDHLVDCFRYKEIKKKVRY